jgi:hypothetical protein
MLTTLKRKLEETETASGLDPTKEPQKKKVKQIDGIVTGDRVPISKQTGWQETMTSTLLTRLKYKPVSSNDSQIERDVNEKMMTYFVQMGKLEGLTDLIKKHYDLMDDEDHFMDIQNLCRNSRM